MNLHKINSFLMIIGIFCLSCVVSLVLAEPAPSFTYENKAMGVKLSGPEGWFIVQTKIV